MPHRSSPARTLIGGAVVTLVASIGLSAAPASADSVNSIPPNKVQVSLIRCTGSTALVRTGSGLRWPNPETWKAYAYTTTTTSADGSITTRMDYWKAAKTYSSFRQCYIGWTRYIYAPETTWTKRFWTITRKAAGGVAVTAGQSGWY
jgi:hypothetical protein